MQRLSLIGARQDLKAVIDRGNSEHQRIAELELENAKIRVMDLEQQQAGADLKAPIAGILTRTTQPLSPFVPPQVITAGVRVNRGQALLAIAERDFLVVSGKIDEVYVNQIRNGQPVMIQSAAFQNYDLRGEVIYISAESEDGAASLPTFEIKSRIFLENKNIRNMIKLGMSAKITIELSQNPKSLVIPIEAVDGSTVLWINPENGKSEKRKITLGKTTEKGIEVLSGLKSGDRIRISKIPL